ncbi:hypothetical protein EJC49_24740 [Aquibium carbonis]|uniref:Sulfotransferase n=1 Tax=Aquibium carbonis TaxID=2495581 RepID=A0A3S0FYX8_9HYPH|nr:sulfotransferase [Aquibium carbonis]RST80105.1 hypothetical protein EJC49_24740 [Aquibium carbonis]
MTDCHRPTDALLTGLPRSGTTLTCHLLNKLPDSVALHEPMQVAELAALAPSDMTGRIEAFFAQQRAMIEREGKATSKSNNGSVPSNPWGNPDESGVRRPLIDGLEIEVRNVTGPDFRLYMKHPAFFTAALPILAAHFECFAIVRNPLAVLLSWRNVPLAVGEGWMPAAQRHDRALDAALKAQPSVLERQFILLDYCFQRYADHLPGRTLAYEAIIASRGRSLALVDPRAERLDEALHSRNGLRLTRDPDACDIARRLVDRDSPCWLFYDRAEVEAVASAAAHRSTRTAG